MNKTKVYAIDPTEQQLQLGARLRQARNELGLTTEEVANRMQTTRASISRWERAIPPPDLRTLERLAEIYGTPVDWFLGRTADMNDQLADLVVGVIRQIVRGEAPAEAFESVTAERFPLSARDRRWMEARAEAIRNEIQRHTGRDLQELSEADLRGYLQPFLDTLLRQHGHP